MDERLVKALEFSNYKITLESQKELARLKFEEATVYGHNGGVFQINQELVGFISALMTKTNKSVVLDKNGTPILIEDLKVFLDTIVDIYSSSANSFHQEFERIKKSRSVQKLNDE